MRAFTIAVVFMVCVILMMGYADAKKKDRGGDGGRKKDRPRRPNEGRPNRRPQEEPEMEEVEDEEPTLPPRDETPLEELPLRKPKGSRGKGDREDRPPRRENAGRRDREGRPSRHERPGKGKKPDRSDRPRKAECGDYYRGQFSNCNETSGMRTLTLTIVNTSLVSGGCPETKIHSVPCERACKYEYDVHSPCDPETNMKSLTGTLIRTHETPEDCPEEFTKVKPCERMNKPAKNAKVAMKKQKKNKGKYDCGGYAISKLTLCNATSLTRKRNYTALETDLPEHCPEFKLVEVPCSKDCKYDYARIPECDEETNLKSMSGTLIVTQHTPSDCPPENHKHKPCHVEERPERDQRREKPRRDMDLDTACQYGEWGEFSECMEAKKWRTREVISGPRKCKRLSKELVEC